MMLSGAPATFTMCNACEWKGWRREGRDLTLEGVLNLVASRQS